MASLAVINIGTITSGDLDQPLLDGDCVLVEDGKISAIGGADQLNANSADTVVDANGATVLPGLIDSHFHVAIGDYQPRQKVVDFIDSYTHGGVTSMISAGEIHTPGRPNDAAGVKALAILSQRSYSNLHPNGAKVHAGAVVLEPTLREKDFEELAAEGIWLAKFGFGDYSDPYDGESQIRWAQKNGIKVMCHSGGASIPGSTAISATHLLQLKPDICGHVNGGPTSLDNDGLRRLVSETDLYLQLVQAGNLRSSLFILGLAQEHDGMGRVVVGSDTPTGTGMMPLGVVKTITELSSLGRLPAATALCLATGNNAKAWGLNSGIIAPGRDADLLIADAPNGSTRDNMFSAMENGDVPGIGVVIIDSVIRVFRSRNSPPPAKVPRILKQPTPSLPSF